MKKTIALMFGGPSPENEISVISAMQVMENYDTEKYTMVPVYVSREGDMYSGSEFGTIESYKNIEKLIASGSGATLQRRDGEVFLVQKSKGIFSKEKTQNIDGAYMAFHGPVGESGGYQGLCEVLNLPYTGSNVAGAAIGFDKVVMKQMCERFDVPVAPYDWFYGKEFDVDQDAIQCL
jgi:D-alanine-D-alanine ligase